MKKIIQFSLLAAIIHTVSAQEIKITQDAATAVKDLGVECKRLDVAKDACVIVYFKEVKNLKGKVIDWTVSQTPSDVYRILLGKTADQGFVIEDYYDNGQKQSDSFKSFEKIAILNSGKTIDLKLTQNAQSEWDRNGIKINLNNYVNGLAHGRNLSWYDNGQKQGEGEFKNGLREGLWNYWNRDGQKILDVNFVMGNPEGIVTTWYDNGQKATEGNTLLGEKNGLWKTWYKSGVKRSEEQYLSGKRNGLYKEWHENGKKLMEMNYVDGVFTGDGKVWNEKGEEEKVTKQELDVLDELFVTPK